MLLLLGGGRGEAVVEAAQAQAHAAELEAMVASTLTLATQVDEDYASALAASSGGDDDDQKRDPDRADRRGRFRDPIVPWLSERRGKGKGGGGGTASGDELGEPVPGEHAEMPGVDPWQHPGDSEGTQVSDPDRRLVRVDLRLHRGLVLLEVENTMAVEPVFSTDGTELVTTKPDTQAHGFGVKSIRHAAATYDGEVTVTLTDEGTFLLRVLLPVPVKG